MHATNAEHNDSPKLLAFFHLWIGLLIVAVPFAFATYFPSTDGPIHATLTTLLTGVQSDLQDQFYVANEHIEPNFAAYLLGAIASFFGGHARIEWLMALTISAIYVLGSFLVLRRINGSALWFYFLLVSSSHYFLHMGFMNYSLSIALFILALSALPALDAWSPLRRYLAISFMMLGLVLTHLVGFAAFCVALAGLATGRIMINDGRPWFEKLRSWVTEGTLSLLAAVPAAALAASFFLRHGLSEQSADIVPFKEKMLHFLSQAHLYSFHPAEVVGFAPLLALIGALVIFRLAQLLRAPADWRTSDGFALGVIVLICVYFFFPLTTKNVPIGERLLPFILVLTVLFVSTMTLNRRLTQVISICTGIFVVAFTGYKSWQYNRIDTYLLDYHSVLEDISGEVTVLPVHFWDQAISIQGNMFTWRTDPFRHTALHSLTDRGSVSLRNALMSSSVFGYMPYVFRDESDPYQLTTYDYSQIPDTEGFLQFETCSEHQVDYLVVFFETEYQRIDSDVVAAFQERIADAYTKVRTSPMGLTSLYQRNADSDHAAVDDGSFADC